MKTILISFLLTVGNPVCETFGGGLEAESFLNNKPLTKILNGLRYALNLHKLSIDNSKSTNNSAKMLCVGSVFPNPPRPEDLAYNPFMEVSFYKTTKNIFKFHLMF